jgi:hypothetical protein
VPSSIARAAHAELTHQLERLLFWKCELRAVRVRPNELELPAGRNRTDGLCPRTAQQIRPSRSSGHRSFAPPTSPRPSRRPLSQRSRFLPPIQRVQRSNPPKPHAIPTFPIKTLRHSHNSPPVTLCYGLLHLFSYTQRPRGLSRPPGANVDFRPLPSLSNLQKPQQKPFSAHFFSITPGVRPRAISLFSSGRKGITSLAV